MCLGAGRPQESGADGTLLAWGEVSLEDYCKTNIAKMAECTSKPGSMPEHDVDSTSEISTDSGKVKIACTSNSSTASEHDADSNSEISTHGSKVWDAPLFAHQQGAAVLESSRKAGGCLSGPGGTPQVHRLVSMYNELSEAREKHKQCISLLQTKASMQGQPHESRALSRQVSSELEPVSNDSERKVTGRRAVALSEVQARHAVCIGLTRDRKAPTQALRGPAQNSASDGSHDDLLPVLFAQIAVNHVNELAELRMIKEAQETLLLQHEALLSENSALRLRNEAILEELRTQTELDKERCTGHPKLFTQLSMVAATMVAAGAAMAIARARS